jgi:signal transduction histidine kinase
LDGALEYFQKSLRIEKELNDQKGISESLNNVAGVYFYQGKADEAIKIFKEVLEIEKSIKNNQGIASTYNNIAQVLIESNSYENAKNYIDSAHYFAKSNQIADDYLISLENYILYHQNQQQYKEANEYYENYFHAFDSINKNNNLKQLTEVETKYQTEKKEKQILKQRAEIAESKLSLERKNSWMIIFIGLALLTGLIGYFVYRNQKLKNRQLEKENKLKDALIKIETQNKIQEERLRISRDLHDNIGSQLTFIISSLDNLKFQLKNENPETGKRIENINQFTKSTINELRDTIWAMSKESISFSDLRVRVNHYLENAKMAKPGMNFIVETDENVDENRVFSAFEGINIYRVIQESVNNSIKHSGAEEIKISFAEENGHLQIQIRDNGKGFDESNQNFGNGLNNMHKRMAEIGGEFKIQSGSTTGTRIQIYI